MPGSALTLAAGAIFGVAWGTLTVSLAATSAAALAFLLSRYDWTLNDQAHRLTAAPAEAGDLEEE